MYNDATCIDTRFESAAVYYSSQFQSYILVIERTANQYFPNGDGYPVNESILHAAANQYPIDTIAIVRTDALGLVLFDATQYYTGRRLTGHGANFRYAPLSNARFLLIRHQSLSNEDHTGQHDY